MFFYRIIFGITLLLASAAISVPLSPESYRNLKDGDQLGYVLGQVAEARSRGLDSPGRNIMPSMRALQRDDADETTLRVPVILVEFEDNQADGDRHTQNYYTDLLFSQNAVNQRRSLKDYYIENSYGEVLIIGEVVGWYMMPEDYSYYVDNNSGTGDYPRNAQRMAEDAFRAADDDIDFSDYDNDGDGIVDAAFIVHAGPGAEANNGDEDMIWSHRWDLNRDIELDGVTIHDYTTEPEDGQIGVFCHELGHNLFGLKDLYDTRNPDMVDDYSAGLGDWSLMANGNWGGGGRCPVHFDAWCKMQIGWMEPEIIQENSPNTQIYAAEVDFRDSYIIWRQDQLDDEFFLLEYRRRDKFDSNLPGGGILIYHVDNAIENNNNPWFPGHQNGHCLVAIEQADGEWNLEQYENLGDQNDSFVGLSEFGFDSEPNSISYNGLPPGVTIRVRSTDLRLYDWVVDIFLSHRISNDFTQLLLFNNSGMLFDVIDYDSDFDFFTFSGQSISIIENRGMGEFLEHIVSENPNNVRWAATEDLDNDGDLDIVSRNTDGLIVWENWEDEGNINFDGHRLNNEIRSNYGLIVDLDQDGNKDIVYASEYNRYALVILQNSGDLEFESREIYYEARWRVQSFNTTDFDIDGDIDFLAICENVPQWGNATSYLVWFENDGEQNFRRHIIEERYVSQKVGQFC